MNKTNHCWDTWSIPLVNKLLPIYQQSLELEAATRHSTKNKEDRTTNMKNTVIKQLHKQYFKWQLKKKNK